MRKRPRLIPLEERIWRYVDKTHPSGCWLWLGATGSGGYGQIHISPDRGVAPAHRAMYELLVGLIPKGLELDHLCRTRACVNPAHLEPVTRSENMLRGAHPVLSRLKWSTRTHCKNGHEFNEKNLYVAPSGQRSCRQCKLAYWYANVRVVPVERTHCKNGHPWDEKNTGVTADGKWRRCLACHREQERARKQRKREYEASRAPFVEQPA